uniref:Uncharacterized protein n=1 Tax=Peronospora matthiolae TaxID=2874970 RepID=A0AAV1TMI5_9STRA
MLANKAPRFAKASGSVVEDASRPASDKRKVQSGD